MGGGDLGSARTITDGECRDVTKFALLHFVRDPSNLQLSVFRFFYLVFLKLRSSVHTPWFEDTGYMCCSRFLFLVYIPFPLDQGLGVCWSDGGFGEWVGFIVLCSQGVGKWLFRITASDTSG